MAKLRGRGIAAVNYPTGMNLGGDPTQALIFCQPTGGFSVKLASTDLGQGLKTVIGQIAAETLGVPLEVDHDRHRRHRLGAALHGHLRQPRHPPRRQRRDHGRAGGQAAQWWRWPPTSWRPRRMTWLSPMARSMSKARRIARSACSTPRWRRISNTARRSPAAASS